MDSNRTRKRIREDQDEQPESPAVASAPLATKPGGERPVYVSRRNAPLDFSDDSLMHFPYKANFNDHFETSIEALRDLMPVVEAYRSLVRPNCPDAFTVYDPYYCAGAIRQHWADLGVAKLIHEKRDFYQDVEDRTVPSQYDILITNPPYSEDHIQRLLEFLIGSNKAWAFLVPDYVASKDWYVSIVESCFTPNTMLYLGQNAYSGVVHPAQTAKARVQPFVSSFPLSAPPAASVAVPMIPLPGSAPQQTTVGLEPFYVVPRGRYDFKHPLGAGHDSSHFKSMWFVWCGRRTNDVLRAVTAELASRQAQRQDVPTVVSGLAGLRKKNVVRTETRKNPKQRAKERGQ